MLKAAINWILTKVNVVHIIVVLTCICTTLSSLCVLCVNAMLVNFWDIINARLVHTQHDSNCHSFVATSSSLFLLLLLFCFVRNYPASSHFGCHILCTKIKNTRKLRFSIWLRHIILLAYMPLRNVRHGFLPS